MSGYRLRGALAAATLMLPSVAAGQMTLTAAAVQRSAEHRVSGSAGVERTEGQAIGVAARLALPARRVELHVQALGGDLQAVDALGESRDVGEVAIGAAYEARSWLRADGSLLVRGYATPLARQRWILLRLGGTARAPLLDGTLHAVAHVGVAPMASVSGLDAPRLPVDASSGLEVAIGRFEGAMLYGLERYDFPRDGLRARREQLTSLTLRAGWRIGRGPVPAR